MSNKNGGNSKNSYTLDDLKRMGVSLSGLRGKSSKSRELNASRMRSGTSPSVKEVPKAPPVYADPADYKTISLFLPLHTNTRGNSRQHWRKDHAKTRTERDSTRLLLNPCVLPEPPAKITLTRCAPRQLDKWNLPSALKAVIDGIADSFGVDDRHDDLLQFHFKQKKQKEVGVEILIEISNK